MQTRWSAYAGVSVALAGGVVVKALAQRPNFYSAAVYLSQSSANLMILTNMVFVVACTTLLGMQKLLYGPLRPIEIEQLYEKAWFAVTETCLAMTLFRGAIGAWFLVMFFSLLAGKIWAWIGEGRIEILEQQPPHNPRLFHTRLALSLSLSVLFSISMLEFVVTEVMNMPKPDMMVMFGFEFAVLSIMSLGTAARYAINLAEIAIVRKQKAKRVEDIRKTRAQEAIQQMRGRSDSNNAEDNGNDTTTQNMPPNSESLTVEEANAAREAALQPVDEDEIEVEGWEGKGRWIFYLDLTTDFLKLVVYVSFFCILMAFYGLPIHILRDVFMTFRSFVKRITDFIKYRNATRDMNTRYPDATEQDFRREDVCIICREEMQPYQAPAPGQPPNPIAERMRPKKLPCGHVLHFACLRSWLERQQICPTCRTSVTPTDQNGTSDATPAQAPDQQGQNAPRPARGAARGGVIQLGPLRIAVGAARGNNMIGDLQQRLGDRREHGAQPAANANENGPQQYGFGIRWDGMRRRERRGHTSRSVQEQLDSAERQIRQEISSLQGSMVQLQVLRNLEIQLAALRQQRQDNASAGAQSQEAVGTTSAPGAVMQTQLTGDSTRNLGPGDPNLPAGLTLPEGWTMMPLNPAQGIGQGGFQVQGHVPFPQMPFQTPNPMMQRGTVPMRMPAPFSFPFRPGPAPVHANPNNSLQSEHIEQQHGTSPAPVNEFTNVTTNGVTNLADLMSAIANPQRTRNGNHESDSNTQSHGRTADGSGHSTEPGAAGPATDITTDAPSAPLSAQAATGTTPALPLWGSNPVHPNAQSNPSTSQSNGASSVAADTHSTNDDPPNMQRETQLEGSASEHTSTKRHGKHSTVEDLVEGPD